MEFCFYSGVGVYRSATVKSGFDFSGTGPFLDSITEFSSECKVLNLKCFNVESLSVPGK